MGFTSGDARRLDYYSKDLFLQHQPFASLIAARLFPFNFILGLGSHPTSYRRQWGHV